MYDLKITWITGWDNVFSAEVRQIWLNHYKLDAEATVFQHPLMGESWLQAYRQCQQLEPLFCLIQNQFQSLFYPLVLWHRNGKNCHQKLAIPVGFSDFDYLNPLMISSESSSFPVDFYRIIGRDLTQRFHADAVQFTGISQPVRVKHNREILTRQICPLLYLNRFSCFENFVSGLKASLRGDIRRQQRNLAQQGEILLHIFDGNDVDGMCSSLSELLVHRALRWPMAFTIPDFFQQLVRNMAATGLLHFSELRLGSEVVSRHLGFVHRRRFYYYLPAVSPLFSHYSPGKIHLFYLHQWAFENGIEIFDHLRGDEAYKRDWSDSFDSINGLKMESRRPLSLIKNSWVNAKDKINVLLS